MEITDVDAVTEERISENVIEERGFLGLFVAKFIPDMASVVELLRTLTNNFLKFKWDSHTGKNLH